MKKLTLKKETLQSLDGSICTEEVIGATDFHCTFGDCSVHPFGCGPSFNFCFTQEPTCLTLDAWGCLTNVCETGPGVCE